MRRIFQTPPPPYRVGTRTADAYVPATDEQRKYMERQLAVCEYINLPKNNRMEVLAYIIADLKAENMKLEQRVHQLMDDYNDVVHQLNEKEKQHDEKTPKQTSFDMNQLRYHCDTVEMKNKELERFAKAIHSFVKDKKLYMAKATNCPYYQDGPHVCSTFCLECKSCLGIIEGLGVICEKKFAAAKVRFIDVDD